MIIYSLFYSLLPGLSAPAMTLFLYVSFIYGVWGNVYSLERVQEIFRDEGKIYICNILYKNK